PLSSERKYVPSGPDWMVRCATHPIWSLIRRIVAVAGSAITQHLRGFVTRMYGPTRPIPVMTCPSFGSKSANPAPVNDAGSQFVGSANALQNTLEGVAATPEMNAWLLA